MTKEINFPNVTIQYDTSRIEQVWLDDTTIGYIVRPTDNCLRLNSSEDDRKIVALDRNHNELFSIDIMNGLINTQDIRLICCKRILDKYNEDILAKSIPI